jgi:O-antigen biosynthesis protein
MLQKRPIGTLAEALSAANKKAKQGAGAGALKVCFVTPELAEFHQNGGIGTATSGLIEHLGRDGVAGEGRVSVLYTGNLPDDTGTGSEFFRSLSRLKAKGVQVHLLRQLYEPRFADSLRMLSYACHDFLRQREYDVIHFNDYCGNGFYATQAKRCGSDYLKTLLVTCLHGPKLWASSADRVSFSTLDELEQAHLEQRAIENSDVCIAVSRYLVEWLGTAGVALPERTYVHRNCHPVVPHARGGGLTAGALRRVAFFGRLDERKGVDLFVEALTKFLPGHPGIEIVFCGKFSRISGEHSAGYVLERLKALPNPISFHNRLDRDDAMRELAREGTLAVIPSHDENSPCVIVECQQAGIPFIATRVGGIPELVAEDDWAEVLVEPTAAALAVRLAQVAEHGHKPVAQNANEASVRELWSAFHKDMVPALNRQLAESLQAMQAEDQPLVSICITHYRRPHLLPRLFKAISLQTYKNIEVVLVDDGSAEAATQSMLEQIRAYKGFAFPIRVVEIENSYLGAARNAAAAHAKGEYLKFQDDDNLPTPQEVEKLVRAARSANAAAVTCMAFQFEEALPATLTLKDVTYFPLGDAGPLAYMRNEYGDANSLVHRETFEALGGFTEDRGIGYEDYEYFARLTSAGHRLVLVPEPLFFYRVSADSMLQKGNMYADAMRARRGFADAPADVTRALADLMHGQNLIHEINAAAWYRAEKYREPLLHHQLMGDDPNCTDAEQKVADLMARYGRIEDAFRFLFAHQSLTPALGWMETEGQEALTARNAERGQMGHPMVIALRRDLGVRLLAPDARDLPPSWQPEWDILDDRPNGLLLHPVAERVSVACIPLIIPKGARRVTVQWTHGHPEGPTVFVAIAIGRDAEYSSSWACLEAGAQSLSTAVSFKPLKSDADLMLRTRVEGADAYAWSIARFIKIEF